MAKNVENNKKSASIAGKIRTNNIKQHNKL
jgi:hypothetical protein